MTKSVIIDFLPESVRKYNTGWAIVVIDVIRATTTAITAVAAGRRCFASPSVDAALATARTLEHPLLAGEFGGEMPAGFEANNSPVEFARRTDVHRPAVLVSSSGTKAIHEAQTCEAAYLACFRCYTALAGYVSQRHAQVALIGAGTKGEFREEDQICCAWIAAILMDRGYMAGSSLTKRVVNRWHGVPPSACLRSRSVDFLRRTGQLHDLEFIMAHIDDLDQVFAVRNGEVRVVHEKIPANGGVRLRPGIPV
jgi:2-phosphosulfolactate phosphatase